MVARASIGAPALGFTSEHGSGGFCCQVPPNPAWSC